VSVPTGCSLFTLIAATGTILRIATKSGEAHSPGPSRRQEGTFGA
jgi:hypothetical protein